MPVFNVSATGSCPVFKDQRQIVITVEKSSFLSSGVEYVPRRYDCPCSDSCTVIDSGEDCPIFANFSYH